MGLVPILLITIAMDFLGLDHLNITVFLLGFIFPYAIHTPGLKEKVSSDQYRFSFLRFSLTIYEFAYDLVPKFKKPIAALIYPIIFSGLLILLTQQMNLHYCFLGWLSWMLFDYLNEKRSVAL